MQSVVVVCIEFTVADGLLNEARRFRKDDTVRISLCLNLSVEAGDNSSKAWFLHVQ